MSEQERTREIQAPSSAVVAELYALVHRGLEDCGGDDDGHSRAASWGTITGNGAYEGYVHTEAVNPFSEFNETGLCAIITVGELDESKKVDLRDPNYVIEMGAIDHVTRSYYIYHAGSRLNIGVNTTLAKPSERNSREESEELLRGDPDLGQLLSIVYEEEAQEVISRLKNIVSS